MLTLRAQNWINGLAELTAARAAGAGWLRVCPANDVASAEVLAELQRRALPVAMQDGYLCVSTGVAGPVYERPGPTLEDAAVTAVEAWLASSKPMTARGRALLAKVQKVVGDERVA